MKILFICGSLEPGFDGVGDYTRRLAIELIKHGHETAALALNDQFIKIPVNQVEVSENVSLQIFKIPADYSKIDRFKLANDWIDQFNPLWLSLQFVPFSFNDKGLPFGLGKQLSSFTKGRYWHIMFHELWVGMKVGSTIKHIIWGEIQKLIIKNLLKNLKPNLIDTQTKLYQLQLAKFGFNASHLPLFSNIPINLDRKSQNLENKNKITFVNFGTIHPGSQIEIFAHESATYAKEKAIKVDLILVGRCGAEQENWIKTWQFANLNISVMGEQSVKNISEIFWNSTFGISTTAYPLIEKSGSVAAMQEHDLPIICIAAPWHPRGINNLPLLPGIIKYSAGNFDALLAELNNSHNNSTSVTMVSNKLMQNMLAFKVNK